MFKSSHRSVSNKKLSAIKDNYKKRTFFGQVLFSSLLLYACGSKKPKVTTDNGDEVSSAAITLTPVLSEGNDYISEIDDTEIISTTYNVAKTISSIKDNNTSDKDTLIIETDQDIALTPNISGFEFIEFSIGEKFTTGDEIFFVDMESISNFELVKFYNSTSNTNVGKVSVVNANGNMTFGGQFKDIFITTEADKSLDINTTENANITVFSAAGHLTINGGGKTLDMSTSSLGTIDISNTSSVTLTAPDAEENLNITSNGDVTIKDVSSLKGNIKVSSIGKIELQNAKALSGKLELENLRALPGSDIEISQANLAKSIDIKSVGAINATQNGGLESADNITISAAESSQINAISNSAKNVVINSSNQSNTEVIFDLNIESMETLALGGSAPLLIKSPGENLNKTTVTTTNSAVTALNITSANTDLSNVSSNIKIQLDNFDGKIITVGQNQNLAINSEVPQTSVSGTPEYRFVSGATSSTSNTISISTFDSNPDNSDNLASIAGLNLTDVQVLNLDLSSDVDFETSQNIVGNDLQTVNVNGSGNINLNNNTIIGVPDGSVSMSATNMSGNLTVTIDNTVNGFKSVTSGSGNDNITIDSATNVGSGISVNTSGGQDNISLTSNSDGYNAKLTINGGDGIDKLSLATGLDFSLSNLSISAIETLELTGGSNSVKLPSDALSTKSYSISENGTGTLTLEVFPTAQVINLSSLTFDTSIVSGADKIIVNGSNFSQALTITGSVMDDEITGTHAANDTISSGDGNDTISGSDGNDTLTPGNGTDQVTSGLGNDTINLAETLGATDTLFYSIDDGPSNVDTVTNFDVRVANDIISIDVSELSNPITHGNGSAASATGAGSIAIVEQLLDTDVNYTGNNTASIIKLNEITKSTFATALGSSELSVAEGATLCFLWFDLDTSEAVFGYVNENSSGPAANTIIAADTFVEITKLAMSSSTYTHFLDADNFAFT